MSIEPQEAYDYYSDNYRNYEDQNPPRKLDHYLGEIERAISTADPKVLDVGCGLGSFLKHAASKKPTWRLYGTEMRKEPVEHLSDEMRGSALIRQGSAEQRVFENQTFDVITAWDVLEHLEDPSATLSELKSWLTPAGVLLFVVPVYDGVTGPLIRTLDKDPTHLHKTSRDFWVEMASAQFPHVQWHGIFRYLVRSGWYVHVPTHRLRRMSPAILVSCRSNDG
jgi:ubiquinone/menaquinone biosynthesis C-methylase UbiE